MYSRGNTSYDNCLHSMVLMHLLYEDCLHSIPFTIFCKVCIHIACTAFNRHIDDNWRRNSHELLPELPRIANTCRKSVHFVYIWDKSQTLAKKNARSRKLRHADAIREKNSWRIRSDLLLKINYIVRSYMILQTHSTSLFLLRCFCALCDLQVSSLAWNDFSK